MIDQNFAYSKALFAWCQAHETPLIYASSAAVYGSGDDFREDAAALRPLNVYGWSKLLFDQWLARQGERSARTVGLRYFNVYGPREAHKGRMASVVHHFDRQLRDTGTVRLFGASHGVSDGEHRRDFVFVGDVVAVNLWAFETAPRRWRLQRRHGQSRSFNDLARAVIGAHGSGRIEYIPMPADLGAAYQAFTEADISRLRRDGLPPVCLRSRRAWPARSARTGHLHNSSRKGGGIGVAGALNRSAPAPIRRGTCSS